jgi:predicted lipoprotein
MVEDGVLHWQDTEQSQPTASELEAEVIRLQAAYDAKEYSRLRQPEYPSIADQLDDIYHNGIDAWKATIKVTKDKYPKG